MNSDFMNDDVTVTGELYGIGGRRQKHPSRGSRAEMEKFFHQLPDRIQAETKTGKLRFADYIVYSIKTVGSSKTIKMFETQDQKETGLRNIANAKLPKNMGLLVSGIYLMQGQAPAATPGSPTSDEIKATQFASLGAANLGAIANGEFTLIANKKILVPATSNRVFVTDNNNNWPLGFYKLHNPRLIQDDVEIEFTLELGTTEDIPQDTYLYVGLFGTITTP